MFSNAVTRFSGGLNNETDSGILSDLPVLNLSKVHRYLQDFDEYTGPVTATTTNGYTLSGTGATAALAALDGGAFNIIGATTGFIASWQRSQGNFQLAAGFPTWFRWMGQIDALTSQLIAGQAVVGATPFTSISDGVWFSSAVTTGEISINIAQNGTVTTVDTGVALVAGALVTMDWYYTAGIYPQDPVGGKIVWQITGAGVSAPVRGSTASPTSFPKAATLVTPTIGIKATSGTPTLTTDLIQAIKYRSNPNATPAF
jgi:hypothetical protein